MFEIIKATVLLHEDSEVVVSIFIFKVLITAGKGILKSFKSNCKHSYVVHFENATKSNNESLVYQNLELLRVCRGSAVA